MGINGTYTVISLGVYLDAFDDIFSNGEDLFDWDGDKMSYHGAHFYNVPSASNSLIVLKKEDVPCYSIAKNDKDGLTEIGTGLGLYSNISILR